MALTSSVGGSAEASRALALATQSGIAGEVHELALFLTRNSVASLLSAPDFTSTTLPDLRSAWLFQWREPFLADFFGATGAPAVSSDWALAAALSALAPACDGPAKHTKSPDARINAERRLASIFICQSPHLPTPKGAMRPSAASAAGQNKRIFSLPPPQARPQPAP